MQRVHHPQRTTHATGAKGARRHVGPDRHHATVTQAHHKRAGDQAAVILHQQKDQQAATEKAADQIAAALNTESIHQVASERFAAEGADRDDGVEQGGGLPRYAKILRMQTEVCQHAQRHRQQCPRDNHL